MSITECKLNLSRTIRRTAYHRGQTLPAETIELFARRWLTVHSALRVGFGDIVGRIAVGELDPVSFPEAVQALGGAL